MLKNTPIWLGSYLKQEVMRCLRKRPRASPAHVIFCFVDHFEPDWNHASEDIQLKRVELWLKKYPEVARKHRDSDGCFPKHTFFYPAEVYRSEHLDMLAQLCRQGFGEVEVHLHHDNDRPESFKQKLEQAKRDFTRHKCLGKDLKTGQTQFGFIHGNWALNNSRSDGKWCGINNETTILKQAGCFADFTLPSAPSDTQTQKINSIYYDVSNGPKKSKSHNIGFDSTVKHADNAHLLIVQGPLALNWRNRKWGIFPKIENSDVSVSNPPTKNRVDLWIHQNICVRGRPEWIFVKVHTHGATDRNVSALLDGGLENLFTTLEQKYNDPTNYLLHYVTAREMYNMIRAAEDGYTGDPQPYRDYEIVSHFGC